MVTGKDSSRTVTGNDGSRKIQFVANSLAAFIRIVPTINSATGDVTRNSVPTSIARSGVAGRVTLCNSSVCMSSNDAARSYAINSAT